MRSHGCPVAPPRLKPVGSRLSVKPPRRGAIFLYSLATWNSQKGHLATFTPTVHLRPSCSTSVEVLSSLRWHGLQQIGHRLGGASRTQSPRGVWTPIPADKFSDRYADMYLASAPARSKVCSGSNVRQLLRIKQSKRRLCTFHAHLQMQMHWSHSRASVMST